MPSSLIQSAQPELELVLVRHGYTQWNKEHRYLGSTDLPLVPGEAKRLEKLGAQPPLGGEFSHVYCSDLRRCRETLAALVPRPMPQAVYDSRLKEMDFGAWEGYTYDQLKDNPLYQSWIDNPGPQRLRKGRRGRNSPPGLSISGHSFSRKQRPLQYPVYYW